MTVTPAELTAYVQAAADDTAFIGSCLDRATALTTGLLGARAAAIVPEPVLDQALLETAATLYYKRQTRLGVIGLDGTDAAPVRASRDPLNVARSILGPYMVGIG